MSALPQSDDLEPLTPDDVLLPLKQVAARLHQSVKTVRRRIAEKELQAIQLSSRAWRVRKSELDRFITLRSTDVATPLRFLPHVSNARKSIH